MNFQRTTTIRPGFDCIYDECRHPTKGEHGISSDEAIHAVATELADGRRVAIVISVGTDNYPKTIPATHFRGGHDGPRPHVIELHVQTELAKVVRELYKSCTLLSGLPCEIVWDSGIEANRLIEAIPGMGNRYQGGRFTFDPVKLPEVIWAALEAKLVELVKDPTLFTQPDETPTMADVRTRHEQALAASNDASKRLDAAAAELAKAISGYSNNDPAYRTPLKR